MEVQQTITDPAPDEGAAGDDPGADPLAEAAAEETGEASPESEVEGAVPKDAAEELAADDTAAGESAAGESATGERAGQPGARRERPRKPARDPHEPRFGALFLDELQRAAGLRGQFAYGVPESLWHANREQTIRILRTEVPMPTFKNQVQCILNSDPVELARDVHFEMLSSAAPVNDSFRWLWLYMMLR